MKKSSLVILANIIEAFQKRPAFSKFNGFLCIPYPFNDQHLLTHFMPGLSGDIEGDQWHKMD